MSRARFIDHLFPNAFGFEDQLDRLADRALAGEGFGRVVRNLFDLGDFGMELRFQETESLYRRQGTG